MRPGSRFSLAAVVGLVTAWPVAESMPARHSPGWLFAQGTGRAARGPSGATLPYDKMARRIVDALKLSPGERVLLRLDPNTMPELHPAVRDALVRTGGQVETLHYGPVDDLEGRLSQTDVYVWLPASGELTPDDQRKALARWTDLGGTRREVHFHWSDGTRDLDANPTRHTPEYDRLYADALDIDYVALASEMDRAIALLRSGDVHVSTPAGTDLRFQVGDRPFNKQDGDASRERMTRARMRIDRHIELPAGILRVAPVEDTVAGTIVFPTFDASPHGRATGVRLEFQAGRLIRATAANGQAALDAYLDAAPALRNFREFCLGFNPKLAMKPGERVVPYYGYGAGVVRLSLGDNEELAGRVRGADVRWNFVPDATVAAAGRTLVRNGRLDTSGAP